MHIAIDIEQLFAICSMSTSDALFWPPVDYLWLIPANCGCLNVWSMLHTFDDVKLCCCRLYEIYEYSSMLI